MYKCDCLKKLLKGADESTIKYEYNPVLATAYFEKPMHTYTMGYSNKRFGTTILHPISVGTEFSFRAVRATINYCPICGKKLEDENEKK